MEQSLKEFPVAVYGNLEQYNEVVSRARCRIFYKYENRNGTYITDEFAEQLISSLPYVPLKGIFSAEEGDYTDHGTVRSQGRIYGIVPENPHFAWEMHQDEDGVMREYACADVLIFTALYEEAKNIIGKSQSMELYEPSLTYHYAIKEGQRYVVFDSGCFLGLQVLGDKVEPCFEGAAFYTLQKTIEDTINKIKEYNIGGQPDMPVFKFKLSDSAKADALWALLNPDCTEENGWAVSYAISDIYDDYALAYNYETCQFERVYYTKNEEDLVELGNRVPVYVMDITAEEKSTLDTLRKLNGNTYELVSDVLTNAEETAAALVASENSNAEFSAKVAELETEITTLNTNADNLSAEYELAKTQIAELNSEVENLTNYKHSVETEQKKSVVAEYSDKLPEEVIETYSAKLDDYTVVDLDKELAYELKKSNSAIFANKKPEGFVPKDVSRSGVEEILSHYKK